MTNATKVDLDRRAAVRAIVGTGMVGLLPFAASTPLKAAAPNYVQTALLLIDLQRSNASVPFKPHSFDQVVDAAAGVATELRRRGGLVVHTRVLEAEMLVLPADEPLPAGKPAADGATLDPRLAPEAGDAVVTKRQWGAFYATDLDQQLRRHDIRTLMIAGVATEVGVESTVREAYDRGYDLIFLQDAISGASVDTHEIFLRTLFPRMGLVRSTTDGLGMLTR